MSDSSQKPTPEHVYLLISWDDRSDHVVAVCATLERAQAVYLEGRYPTSGPRGGRRPPRPDVIWEEADWDPGHWTPSDGPPDHGFGVWQGDYIERHTVDHGSTDGEATT